MPRPPRADEAGGLYHVLNRPISPLSGWVDRVKMPLSEAELAAVRLSAQRGKPWGDDDSVESIARRLNLESTLRPRGRKRVRFPKESIKA